MVSKFVNRIVLGSTINIVKRSNGPPISDDINKIYYGYGQTYLSWKPHPI